MWGWLGFGGQSCQCGGLFVGCFKGLVCVWGGGVISLWMQIMDVRDGYVYW